LPQGIQSKNLDVKQLKLPFLQGLGIHANRLQQFRLKQQIDYCIDVVFYRKRMEYGDELIAKLSNLDMLKPELLAILDCNLQARKGLNPHPKTPIINYLSCLSKPSGFPTSESRNYQLI
jgi:hypothetical protein